MRQIQGVRGEAVLPWRDCEPLIRLRQCFDGTRNKGGIHSDGGLFLRTLLAESLSIFHDLAMGETAATEAKRRWNAEGAGMPPLPNHRKNKGRRHQCEENKATP